MPQSKEAKGLVPEFSWNFMNSKESRRIPLEFQSNFQKNSKEFQIKVRELFECANYLSARTPK